MLSTTERERLQTELAKYISGKRYVHSLNVAAAALKLAELYAPDLADKAELAGMLHDNAKKMSTDELMEQVRRFDIEPSLEEFDMPELLHGEVGAYLLPERFGIEDAEIEQACADHVTGRAGMGMLSRILYVADQIAADRKFPGVDELRELAKQDLTRALLWVARFKLYYSLERERPIESGTVGFYNSVLRELGLPAD